VNNLQEAFVAFAEMVAKETLAKMIERAKEEDNAVVVLWLQTQLFDETAV
jgi:hypothetical protein